MNGCVPESTRCKLINSIACLLILTILLMNTCLGATTSLHGTHVRSNEAPYLAPSSNSLEMPSLGFIENKGQLSDEAIHYYIRTSSGDYAFYTDSVCINLVSDEHREQEVGVGAHSNGFPSETSYLPLQTNIRLTFVDSNAVVPYGREENVQSSIHLIKGKSEPGGYELVTYSRLIYLDIYDGIDLVYTFEDNRIKYEYIVHPEADPNQLVIEVAGHDGLSIYRGQTLTILTAFGPIQDEGLKTYYQGDSHERISCEFQILSEEAFTFHLGPYDTSQTIVIDPIINTTVFGGSDPDEFKGITTDETGNIYMVGSSYSTDFSTTPGVVQTMSGDSEDAVLVKLSHDGTTVEFSTYIGGMSRDSAEAITIDNEGKIYITGRTNSTDFPVTDDVFQRVLSGYDDGFICILNDNGSSFIASSYFGGRDKDVGNDILLDDQGNIIVVGSTRSHSFPTTPTAYQRSIRGLRNAFVIKFDVALKELGFSTYLGGDTWDTGVAVAIGPDGNILLAGSTSSSNFPTIKGCYQTTQSAGSSDAYIAKLSVNGSELIHSTFLGGWEIEEAFDLHSFHSGDCLIIGTTASRNFPTTNNALQRTYIGGEYDSFLTRMDGNLTSLISSTYFGGSGDDYATAIDVNESDAVVVTGWTTSKNLPATDGTWNSTAYGKTDGYLVLFDSFIGNISFCSYFGGIWDDKGLDVAFSSDILAYIVGFETPGQVGKECLLIKYSGDDEPPVADAGNDIVIDQYEYAFFNANGSTDNVGVVEWTWTFDYNGSQVILTGPTFMFQFLIAGVYNVTLSVADEARNKATDDLAMLVRDIEPPIANAGIDVEIDQDSIVSFNGTLSSDNVGIVIWTWEFLYDDTMILLSGPTPSFVFMRAGMYRVTLLVTDIEGNLNSDEMLVKVQDIEPPTPYTERNIIVDQHESFTLDGSGSYDNVGVVKWNWIMEFNGMAIILSGATVDYTLHSAGIHHVTLVVSDEASNRAPTYITVTVRDITAPVAHAGGNLIVNEDERIFLDASKSFDNVKIVEYNWIMIINGSTFELTGINTSFTFDEPGIYAVILNVSDAASNWDTDIISIRVRDVTPPTANAGSDITILQHETVLLNASMSQDNVQIIDWIWTIYLDDEEIHNVTGPTTEIQFEDAGIYYVMLTVFDEERNMDRSVIWVTVLDTDPPVAIASRVIRSLVGETVRLDGEGSYDNVGITSYYWTIKSGSVEVILDGSNITYEFERAGNYEITLSVSDARDNQGTDSFIITVYASDDEGRDLETQYWIIFVFIAISIFLVMMFKLYRRIVRED